VAIVTNDSVDVHRRFARSKKIAFTLLADKKVEIIEAFGMTNPKYPKGTSWYGIAVPGIFVIDPKGMITHRFTSSNYTDRPPPEAVLSVLRKSAGN
jgi:peroxiredoxin